MRRLLPPFAALQAFDAVAHYGGIRRAAEALSRDHAAVSRHIKAIEEWAGVPLIDRSATANNGKLTPEGQRFYDRIAKALDDITDASVELTRRSDDGLVRVWCVPGLASRWLSARLPDFIARNPGLDIELRPADRSPDLSRHEADADVRYVADYRRAEMEGVQMLEIARPPVVPVASPAYLAGFEPPKTPADLLNMRLLHEETFAFWTAWFGEMGVPVEGQIGGPRLWHAHLNVEAALRGEGVALASSFLVGDDIARGDLVQIGAKSPAWPGVRIGAYVFMARQDRWRSPHLVAFRRWLQKQADQQMQSRGVDARAPATTS